MNADISGSDATGLVLALGLLLCLGRAILALSVREIALGRTEVWALSFLLGAGGISLLIFWLSPVFGIVPARWLLSLITVGLVLLASARGRRLPPRTNDAKLASNRGVEPRWLQRALSVAIGVQCAALVLMALQTSLGWDGLINFEIKARIAFANRPSGRLPLAYLSDASRAWSHPGYPLLVPLTEFWLYSWIGYAHQGLVKLLFPAFYLSLGGLFYGVSSRLMPKSHALLGWFALGLLPLPAIGPGAAITGYADVPLAAAGFGAISFTYLALRTGIRDYFVLAALLSSLAVWTKREGALLAAYVLIAAVVARAVQARREERPPFATAGTVWWLLAAPAIVAGPWAWLQRGSGVPDLDFSPVTLGTLSANVSRLPIVVRFLARELVLPGHWGLLWPAFAMTLVLSTRRLRDVSERFLLGAVLIPMGLYTSVFVFSAWPTFTDHVGTALPRLLISLAPVALLVTIRHLRECLVCDRTSI